MLKIEENMGDSDILLNHQFPDTMYVDIELLGINDSGTVYADNSYGKESDGFQIDQLFESVRKLLQYNYNSYIFNIRNFGYIEYPYLPDLFEYLFSVNRNVKLVLSTDSSYNVNYFSYLINRLPKKQACINITPDFNKSGIKDILCFIGMINEKGQYCRTSLQIDTDNRGNGEQFLEYLVAFKKKIPFILDVNYAAGLQPKFNPEILKSAESFPAWCIASFQQDTTPGYCCCGVNAAHIGPDGSLSLGLSGEIKPFIPTLVKTPVLLPGMPRPPAFSTPEAALVWMDKFIVWRVGNELNGGPVRNPLGRDSADEQLRFRLKHLNVVDSCDTKLRATPALWEQCRKDISSMYDSLDDKNSKDAFLRIVKARALGNSAYLKDIPFTSSVALQEESALDLAQADLDANIEKLSWSGRPFLSELADDDLWLKRLLALRNNLPRHDLQIAQRGINSYVRGLPKIKGLRHITRFGREGLPKITLVILGLPQNGDSLNKLVELAMSSGMEAEIILIAKGVTDAIYQPAVEVIRHFPGYARIFDIEESAGVAAAFLRSLDMASGEYIAFLKSPALSNIFSIRSALNKMAEDGAEVALEWQLEDEITKHSLIEHLPQWHGNWLLFNRSIVSVQDALPVSAANSLDLPIILLALASAANRMIFVEDKSEANLESTILESSSASAFIAAIDVVATLKDFYPQLADTLEKWLLNSLPVFNMRIKSQNDSSEEDIFTDSKNSLNLRKLSGFPLLLNTICARISAPAAITIREYPQDNNFSSSGVTKGNSEIAISLIVIFNEPLAAVESVETLERIVQMDFLGVECIIVDNSCDEATAFLLDRYITLYPNFSMLKAQDKTASSICAREGLQLAKGRLAGFLDAQDEPAPELESIFENMSEKNADIHIFGVQRVDKSGISSFPFLMENSGSGDWALGVLMEQGLPLETAGIFFNRSLLQQADLFSGFDYQDWQTALLLRAFTNATVAFHPDSICVRRAFRQARYYSPDSLEQETRIFQTLDSFSSQWNRESIEGAIDWSRKRLRQKWLPLYRLRQNHDNFNFPQSEIFMKALLLEYAASFQAYHAGKR